jgi:putative methyltransferase (TIGR04325 family)
VKRVNLLRLQQIRFTIQLLRAVETMPGGNRLLQILAHSRITKPAFNRLVGFHRVFDSLAEAEAAAQPYAEGGHKNPENADLHIRLSRTARPSDYAVLFHMQKLIAGSFRIFDFGGNVGNLFYCYNHMLDLPDSVVWQVYELPEMIERGRKIAAERGERRLQFTTQWEDASGCDLLIASGSLHYFETSLAEKVGQLSKRPSHILINRTPLINGATRATVQDAGGFRVGCVLYNKRELLHAFEALGYEVADRWEAPDLNLKLVGDPNSSACPYSGIYLRTRRVA